MIKIYPFRALMPSGENAPQIASEPYDVISAEEARERAAGNANSFLHVVRSEIDFPVGTDPYDAKVYEKAAANLQAMIDQRLLVESDQPGIFIYRQSYRGRQQAGIVCCCDAEQYRSDRIKKHEKTRPDKEDDRTRHMTTCSAHAEPVFLTFQDTQHLTQLIASNSAGDALIDFVAGDDVRHTVWQVNAPREFVDAFARVESLYIADGHHRTAGAERAATARMNSNSNHTGNEEYNRILAVIFPSSQLNILAYNRVVADLNRLNRSQFLDRLATVGNLTPVDTSIPAAPRRVCVYVGQRQWYRLEFPEDLMNSLSAVDSLDVALLQSRVLDPILGIKDPRTDSRIGFVGGVRGTDELQSRVDGGSMAVAFSMFPTRIEQLLEVSDAGNIMPPKSTWFEPKLRSGLFVHRFERSADQ